MTEENSRMSQKRKREEDNDEHLKSQWKEDSNDSHKPVNQPIELRDCSLGTNSSTETGQQKEVSTDFTEAIEEEEKSEDKSIANLSLFELMTQVKLSYQWKKAHDLIFGRKYENDWLHLNASSDIKKWIKIMQFFGHMITKLNIDYAGIDLEDCIQIDHCVNEYCADSLVELKTQSAPRYIMNHMKKPFSKIEIITFNDCYLASNSTDLNRWYPKMRCLVFSGHNILHEQKCIEVNFPNLKELEIETMNKNPAFKKSVVAKAIRMNPGLRRLRIVGDLLNVDFLQSVSRYLQLLKNLEIEWNHNTFKYWDTVIHFKNVETLKITHRRSFAENIEDYFEWPQGVRVESYFIGSIPLSFDKLKELTFRTFYSMLNSDIWLTSDFLEYISDQATLEKLTFAWHKDFCFSPTMSTSEKIELAKACSMLTEIHIYGYTFSASEAIGFLGECRSLKLMRFKLSRSSNYDEFVKNLSSEWQASVEGDTVKVKRLTEVYTNLQQKMSDGRDEESRESEEMAESEPSLENSWSDENSTEAYQSIESETSSYDANICETSSVFTDTDLSENEGSKFTDQSDDILENIELNDLLQAAESNAKSKLAIDTVFLAKYQVESVNFSPLYVQPIEYEDGVIFIGDITVCVNFLRCYGHLIKEMCLDFDEEVLYHLNEYCAESLFELWIWCAEEDSFRKFKKPFLKLEVLQFSNCILNSRLTNFNRWFPRIKCLKFLSNVVLTDRRCIVIPFPHLEHLSIEFQSTRPDNVDDSDGDDDLDANKHSFEVENVKKTLRLNPQLRSIALYNVDAEFLRNISEHLQLLECLEIKWTKHFCYANLEGLKINFENVRNLTVIFHSGDSSAQGIPLSCNRLKAFALEAKELNYDLFEFIGTHRTISKLSLNFEEEDRGIELSQFARELPSLKTFNLSRIICLIKSVIDFLKTCKSLKKFRFKLGDRSKYEDLRRYLGDIWQTSIDDVGYVEVKRIIIDLK